MRARARLALLIGVGVLLALFFLLTRMGEEEDLARSVNDDSNTLESAELPADPPIDGEREDRRPLLPREWPVEPAGSLG